MRKKSVMRFISAALAVCMMTSVLPMGAMAQGDEEAENGVSVLDVSSASTTEEEKEKIAADWVKIDEKNFPDDKFRNFVSNGYFRDPYDSDYHLQKIDQNSDKWLSPDEIAAVKWIDCSERQIEKLTGIGYFTALTYLNCRGNQLTELDVRENKALTELDCMGNQLTELDVRENKALTGLYCNMNQLTKLDVRENKVLRQLCCSVNQLTELNVSQNTELKNLQCAENQLTSLDVENTKLAPENANDNGLVAFYAEKNSYNIVVDPENRFNLSTLPGHFDVSKVKEGSWIGGTVSDGILTVDEGVNKVTYTYDCGTTQAGKQFSAEFTLKVTGNTADPVVPDAPADGGDTDYGGDIAAGVVIGGIAVVGAYEVGTGLYRITQMDDVAMPTNRLALAKLLWERAGKPEPETLTDETLYSDMDAEDEDAQKAARWAVEQELLNDDDSVEGELKFHPAFPASKLRVCLTWENAKQKGLFDQNTEA